jgi:hypothetical protein
MEATEEAEQASDWLHGAMIECQAECSEHVDVPLEGLDFGTDDANLV